MATTKSDCKSLLLDIMLRKADGYNKVGSAFAQYSW